MEKALSADIKLNLRSWIDTFLVSKESKKQGLTGYVYFLGEEDLERFTALIAEHALFWQEAALRKNEREIVYLTGQKGPVWILRAKRHLGTGSHEGLLEESDYGWSRDQFGTLVAHFKVHQLQKVLIEFQGTDEEQELGALTGLEIGSYQFRAVVEDKQLRDLPEVSLKKDKGNFAKNLFQAARIRGQAVNLARHLVNLPPNELNPKTFANLALKGLGLPKSLKVSVWNTQRLQKEGMGLHAAVGLGASEGPCMVHLSYRPLKKTKKKPIAFVGKGITFDSGGLDIKPAAGMRWMKKDMGGAAGVLATAKWVAESNYGRACDFYLALAENSVDAKAFRPGDIFTARNGLRVEIDNTDAEGRLVLADVLDVAATRKGADEPEYIIDVATLTGAIKVGLGADIAGLFSNDDELGEALARSGQRSGDLNWRMPLFDKYFGSMSSPFADFKNSGESFGGAITAALFLQKFVGRKKWAHLDIYAWTDKAQGALLATGGNGQPVQCLIDFLEKSV